MTTINDMLQISIFDLICLLLTLISVFITILQIVKKSDLQKSLHAQMIAIIGNIDSLCASAKEEVPQGELLSKAIAIRSQAIGALKTFSSKEERYKTFDFGIKGDTPEERVRKRKEVLGIDVEGCIVSGQKILLGNGEEILIDELDKGTEVTSWNGERKVLSTVQAMNRYSIKNYIRINEKLELSAEHKVFEKNKHWICCYELSIGDALMKVDDSFERIDKIELIERESEAFSIHVQPTKNLYVGGYLVHNEEEEGK